MSDYQIFQELTSYSGVTGDWKEGLIFYGKKKYTICFFSKTVMIQKNVLFTKSFDKNESNLIQKIFNYIS